MPRVGLVLEGGGAKGAFQIGAVKALNELGYEFDVVVGSSIGTINGAAIAGGKLKELEELWRGSDISDFIEGDPDVLEDLMNGEFRRDVRHFLVDTVKQKGLDTSPLREKLEALIDEQKLRAGKVRFGLTTLAVKDMIPRGVQVFLEEIPEGRLIDYMMGSSNLPGLQPVEIDGARMVDGGFYDNLPIGMLEDYPGEIIAVRIHGIGFIKKISEELESRVRYIIPSEDLGGILEVDADRIDHNIMLGYLDTMRTFGRLYGSQYYFSEIPVDAFSSVPIPQIACRILADLLALPEDTDEVGIVKSISELLGAETSLDKRDMWIRLVESVAASVGAERVKTYSFRTLEETLSQHFEMMEAQEAVSSSAGILDFVPIGSLRSVLIPQEREQLLIKLFLVLRDVYRQYKGDYYGTV
ncbi:MAG: patatin-like phospholipase family protein [Bacillota bacterium]|nr:patatin-like phospholipase family protein [Bacillota bacterium]